MERIKQQLDVARKQREHIQQGYTTSSAHVGHRTWSAFSSEKHRFMAAKDKHIRLFLVITIAIISAMIIWWAVSSMEPEMRLSGIDLLESPQPVVKASSAVEMLEVKIDEWIASVN